MMLNIITAVLALTVLWLWIATLVAFKRLLAQLTEATSRISQGDLDQRVNAGFFLFTKEVAVLNENFNTMTSELKKLRTSREQELAEARKDAVSANKSKAEFVSFVSHELKLPMTSIKGYSDLMLAGATGPLNENQVNFLTTIHNNVNRMATLVSDLVDITRIEGGNIRLEPRVVSVLDVIDEVMTSMKTQIKKKKQSISMDIPTELPQVWCDRARLAQILANLISNANKYTPEEGILLVQATRVDGLIQVKVQDNGLGMTPEDQKSLFSKFFRSTDEKVRDAPGTGLGLCITKNLIELQGGSIWFESEYRKGSTFFFTVPIYQDQDKK